ncbi:Holliday junction resolvase RuvX [Candidiatus Paracoxiella cheracis]|uniref:Holliday junction resolvase RuvX n=1 Tax=Candidiatus Paracoxiella cheracis TaxID=3405120 RepID=UPI003BF59C06
MPKHNTLLGFDFGMRRIGVAVGQMITRTANPVAVLNARDGVPNWEHVQELIDTWNIDAIVVGIPLNMDGSKQPVTFAAQRFANKLSSRYGLPVYTVDERLTTLEAKRHQQKELDSYAAKLILEQWLREQDS